MARRPTPRPTARPAQAKRASTGGSDWLGNIKGARSEAAANLEADRRQREAAGRGPRSVILDPKKLSGQNWDAAKVLYTTLGGQLRPITQGDLAIFRKNIQALRSRLGSGGITARQVVDLSGAYLEPGQGSDRARAKREIHQAIPAGFRKGELHVLTNSGGTDPKITRHHVLVKFPQFDVAVSDVSMTADQAAKWLLKQPLRYDCDCGRHRYFFRYLCTTGNFHAGRAEHGYPKIRNPRLIGVACKHVVRTMSDIDHAGTRFVAFLKKAIEKARDDDVIVKRVEAAQKEAEKQAEASAKAIRTTSEQASRSAQARERAAARAAARSGKAPRKRGTIAGKTAKIAASVAEKFGLARDLAMKIVNFVRKKI